MYYNNGCFASFSWLKVRLQCTMMHSRPTASDFSHCVCVHSHGPDLYKITVDVSQSRQVEICKPCVAKVM